MTVPTLAPPSTTSDRFEEAARLVDERMGSIPRRGGGTAALHSFAVGKLLAGAGMPEDVVIAGLLHDILEDTDLPPAHIRDRFGKDVMALVRAVTKDESKKGAKQDRKHLQAVEYTGAAGVAIKVADNTCNILTPEHLNDPRRYLRYARDIQALGVRYLGQDHELVLTHLSALRAAQLLYPHSI